MRRHDHLRGLVVRPRVLLYEAGDADALLGEDLADGREHAGPVLDADAVVRPRLHVADRDDADPVVEAERGPALHAAPDGPGEVDEVAHHRRCGRPPTGALPDEQHLSDQVAFHEDGVLRALDSRERMLERNHRGMHASLDASWMTLRVRDELDGESELTRVAKVD